MSKQNYTQACAETFCRLASFVPTKGAKNLSKKASDSLCVLLVCLFLDFLRKPGFKLQSMSPCVLNRQQVHYLLCQCLKINVDFQVDLAGSENVGRSGAVDKRLREAGKRCRKEVFALIKGSYL